MNGRPASIAKSNKPLMKMNPLRFFISLMMAGISFNALSAENIQFNTDILDVSDRSNIDLDQFSRAGYIMPGEYNMVVRVNKSDLPEMPITFLAPPDDPKGSEACLSPELMSQIGLKPNVLANVSWWHNGQCANPSSLEGIIIRGDLGKSTLYLSIPQAYMEYSTPDWDPPSRWDEGLNGVLFDYHVSTNRSTQNNGGSSTSSSGNGVAGANIGPWRVRANWQANNRSGSSGSSHNWDWSQYYAYRALPHLGAKLTLGETYLDSSLFDSFRFTGASLRSDDNQLPPNLRGYAPEISGVAKTNAKVTVSQQGRVLYESQVPQGPFLIQDLSDSVAGKLQVRVEEQDGSHQEFEVDTATIPYLSRPGQIRYKIASGKPSDYQHHATGKLIHTGEFSWGISNGWSLLGGAITDGDYNAASLGIGRDLLAFGAVSVDATQSHVKLPGDETKTGGSYRLSYSKRFDEYDTQVTFAGYRFSQQSYMSVNQYLDAKDVDDQYRNSGTSNKQLYTITLNKQFRDAGLSTFINYSHQTYWDRPATDRWNISLASYFDIGDIKNMSINLSAYRSDYNGQKDDGMYLSLSMPWGNSGTLSYNAQQSRGDNSQGVSWYDRIDDNNMYQLSADAASGSKSSVSGYLTHYGDIAQSSASASYRPGEYSSVSLSAQGGVTATSEGAAMHRTGTAGGTRLMVDTDGVSGVPVRGSGAITHTNVFGKAVISDVSNYYRNRASIDINQLGDNVEATNPVTQITLTEGAIGYRKFGVIAGQKLMGIIRLIDGTFPPFGASVISKGRETGIVNDNGNVWLSGVQPGAIMDVRWAGETQCSIKLPQLIADNPLEQPNLLLPCEKRTD